MVIVKTNERTAESWVTRSPGGVPDYASRPLGDELDLHSTFQWVHFLHQGVDAHFIGRAALVNETEEKINTSDFWKRTAGTMDGTFTLSANQRLVSVYSRRAFDYPQFIARIKLPNLTLLEGDTSILYAFGVEHGSNLFNGIACFAIRTAAAYSNRLVCYIGAEGSHRTANIDINKPADFLTAIHKYRVLHSRNLTMFTIDHVPVLFGVPASLGAAVAVKESVLPYSVILTAPIPRSLTTLQETMAGGRTEAAPSDIVVPTSPYQFRVSDGHEVLSLDLPLYEEDTGNLFAGKSVAAGTLVSHPFPIFGYAEKTLYFRADQNSVANGLIIEYYTKAGNWRTYLAETYAADDDWFRTPIGEGVLARLSYEPAAYPAEVVEGEVTLR